MKNTPRNNPRIVCTVNADASVTCKGVVIDSRDNVCSFNRVFNGENQCMDYLYAMRDSGSEFSIQINRKA